MKMSKFPFEYFTDTPTCFCEPEGAAMLLAFNPSKNLPSLYSKDTRDSLAES